MFARILLGILIVIAGLLTIRYITWLPAPYPTPSIAASTIPHFKEVKVDFVHQYNKKKSLPFVGAAIFDMHHDGHQYLFVGGGYNQADKLFRYENGKFADVTQASGLTDKPADDTTYGVAAIDANRDGLIDLFIARESGVYLYTNVNGKYVGHKLNIPLDKKSAPISIAVADLRKNGLVDLFICAYVKKEFVEGQSIFNRKDYGAKSLLLLNNGDNTFKDITKEAGLEYVHNTFQAAFVDLDGDGQLDLVVAYDTGDVRTYKNNGNLTFKNMPNPTSYVFSYPMGIAVGDYNNSGRPSLFFSNIGPFYWWNMGATPPNLIVRGDLLKDQVLLRDNIFLRNDGGFKFSEVAKETKTADYEFGWGTVFQDFNNDGLLDLVIAQNYIGFPPHKLFKLPGRFLLQLPDHTFAAVEKEANAGNPLYGISPLLADFTNNGYADLVYTNVGGPLRVLLNQGGKNHYLKVVMKNNPESLGAVVTVELADHKILTQFFVPTQGLCTYQTNSLIFGLGEAKEITQVKIKYMDGRENVIDHPSVNSTIQIK